MATTKTVLRLSSLEINEVNRLLQSVADRLDKQEGFRGEPEFQRDINLKSNKAINVADAVDAADAVNFGQASGAITTASGTIFSSIGFSTRFVSTQQPLTADTDINVAHGLGSIPVLYQVRLKCITTDLGYAVDDEVDINGIEDDTINTTNTYVNATNIGLMVDANITLNSRTTPGTRAAITLANWEVIFRAWA